METRPQHSVGYILTCRTSCGLFVLIENWQALASFMNLITKAKRGGVIYDL
jgi:hypothetical protein